MALNTAGAQSVTATDTTTSSITGSESAGISPGSAASYRLSGLNFATVGTAQDVTVTAIDAYGNTAIGYTGTVQLTTSTDAAAVLPVPYTFQPWEYGVHTFSVTWYSQGTQWLTATDPNTPSIWGAMSVNVM